MANSKYAIAPHLATELVEDTLRAGLVPMLLSSPGIGKSSIIHDLAATKDLLVIDLRLASADPTDLNGFPCMNEDRTIASYVPMDTFPLDSDLLPIKYTPYKNGKRSVIYTQVESPASEKARKLKPSLEPVMVKGVPARYKGWILFLDEMTSASPAVQAASYKLVLDRMVGTRNLHPQCFIVAAGNKASDKAVVNRTSTALQSRMVWLEIVADAKSWAFWAVDKGVDYRVRAYVAYRPSILDSFNPDHSDHTFCCGRTLEFLSDLILPWKDISRSKLPLLAGTIGEGLGKEFFSFCTIFEELATIEQMLANPDSIEIPTKIDVKWAFSGLIAEHMTSETADKLMIIVAKMPVEFQVLSLQAAFRKDGTILSHPKVRDWLVDNAALMRP